MKLSEVVQILDATLLTDGGRPDLEITKGGASDLMSAILAGMSENSILITGLLTTHVIKTAIVAGVSCIVIVRGKKPSQDVIQMAREGEIPVLLTPCSMFVSCGRLYNQYLTGLDGNR